MVLFESSTRQWRRWIGTRGVAFNVLRLCARRAYTVYELSQIKLREAPGLSRSVSDVLSDINVSVIGGEGERRELLVTVGTVPDPATSGGVTYLLRTTLLAFLLSPALAYAEPAAYAKYLQTWAALPQTRAHFSQMARTQFPNLSQRGLLTLYEFAWRASLVFPRYLSTHWVVTQESPSLVAQLDLALQERKRVFGEFFLADVRTIEESSSRPFGLFALRKGIPQHAERFLEWLVSSERTQLEGGLHAMQTWAARATLWELKRVGRRAVQLAREAPINAAWEATEPPIAAVQPGRFGVCL